jgi:hypothetical protein
MLTVHTQDDQHYRVVLGKPKDEPWLLLFRHEGSMNFTATGFECLTK